MTLPVPLRLDLRHYETVSAIVEAGTMTRAAQSLSVTQSALSHRLAEAERRLGVTLFSRGVDRRLTPTGHGLALHQAASRAITELRRVEESLVSAPAAVEVILRIGVGGYEAYHWFPDFLDVLRIERPDVDLDLVVVGDTVGASLAARNSDLVLAPGHPEGDIDLLPLFDDELVFVCAPGHPLADETVVSAGDLVDETLLTYNAFPTPGFEYDRFVRPTGHSPRIVRVVRQTSAIIELVAAGTGVSILSRWATAPFVASGRLAVARCGPDGLPIPWHVAVRRNDVAAAAIAARLRTHLAPAR